MSYVRPEDLKPLRDDFSIIGVFNPGAVQINNEVVLLVRVAEAPLERRPGFVGLPRQRPAGDIVIDWVSEDELERPDPRIVRRKTDRLMRLTSISHLRVLRSSDTCSTSHNPARVLGRTPGPILRPAADFERAGFVANVVFPTALIERDEMLLVYYGASDTFTGVVTLSRDKLMRTLC